ncbi:hypothetical protein TcasGA2_TC001696 [Tribolium castaneum]|uniref:Uncharacterized protein n=1 Tax=Tribolium castaneum TaxID=7070 RepID=D6W8E9_TRICA|nr:hypothetical protein TcasGA2_TC001696 [Tribolium castaneum]
MTVRSSSGIVEIWKIEPGAYSAATMTGWGKCRPFVTSRAIPPARSGEPGLHQRRSVALGESTQSRAQPVGQDAAFTRCMSVSVCYKM